MKATVPLPAFSAAAAFEVRRAEGLQRSTHQHAVRTAAVLDLDPQEMHARRAQGARERYDPLRLEPPAALARGRRAHHRDAVVRLGDRNGHIVQEYADAVV